jgi:hypothetical protein
MKINQSINFQSIIFLTIKPFADCILEIELPASADFLKKNTFTMEDEMKKLHRLE